MARRERSPIPPRLLQVFIGMGIGAVWGAVIWGVNEALGRDNGVAMLAYLVIVCAMLGGGVAGVFGAVSARKRGEKVMPRSPYRRGKRT